MKKNTLVFASFNQGKIDEIIHVLQPLNIDVISPKFWVDKGPPETGQTFYENALIKATYYRQFTDHRVLADDSGLIIHALDGFPGVRTAEFAAEYGGYPQAFIELEKRLQGLSTQATFFSLMVLLDVDNKIHVFEGKLEGKLVFPPRGDYGFAYCPIFQPQGYDKTLGEISFEERTALNHRGEALRHFKNYLASV